MQAAQGVGLQAAHPAGEDPAGALSRGAAVGGGRCLQNLLGMAGGVARLHELLFRFEGVGSGEDGALSPGVGAQLGGGGVQLCVGSLQGQALGGGYLGEQVAEHVNTLTGSCGNGNGCGEQVRLGTLSLEQTGQGSEHGGHLSGCELVRLVEHAERLRTGGGERHHEIAVDDGVSVFLRVDNPDEHVHVAHHAGGEVAVGGGDRVEVGHVQQNQSAGAGTHFAASANGSADAVEESGSGFGYRVGCRRSPGSLATLGSVTFGGERLSLRVDALVDAKPVE